MASTTDLVCYYCRQSFPTIPTLHRHYTTDSCPNRVSSNRGFRCENCDGTLSNAASLLTHLYKFHKPSPPPVSPCHSLPRTPGVTPQFARYSLDLEKTPVKGVSTLPLAPPPTVVAPMDEEAGCAYMRTMFSSLIAAIHRNPGTTDRSVQQTVMTTKLTMGHVAEVLDHLHTEYANSLVGGESCEHLHGYIEFAKRVIRQWINPLDSVYKRWSFFMSTGALTPSQTVTLTTKKVVTGPHVPEELKDQSGQFVPMGDTLKNLLQIPGLLDEVKEYIASCAASRELVHLTRGSMWLNQELNRDDRDTMLLPINIYFDDFECGNPLGSHAGSARKMGGVYMTLPFLPPRLVSKLDFIFLVMIFSSSDRKEKGKPAENYRIFKWIIRELNALRKDGIHILLEDGSSVRIKFALGCLIGDNLGLNEMMGFTGSFNALRCCRICRATKHDFPDLTLQDPSLLRNNANFLADYNYWTETGATDTGVIGENVWLSVDNFAVDKSVTVDVMHDIYEGVGRYTMQVVLKGLIVRNRSFSLSKLNSIIRNFTYGPDVNSKPTEIRPQPSTRGNFIIRMSASEMRTFLTYFGVMVGHLVKPHDMTEDDDDDSGVELPPPAKQRRVDDSSLFFYLYNLLSEILSIVCSNSVTIGRVAHLRLVIRDFLALYMRLSALVRAGVPQASAGDDNYDDDSRLQPKFHLLTHYPDKMLQLGPLNALSSMRCEGKHKFVKKSLALVSSSVNPPFSAAKKVQLSNMSMILENKLPPRVHIVSKLRAIDSTPHNYHRQVLQESEQLLREKYSIEPQTEIRYCAFVETADSVRFSPEHGVCVGINMENDGYPSFAEIIDFFCTIPNKEIFFSAYDYETVYFSYHHRAYELAYTGTKSFYRLDDVVEKYPFPNTIIKGKDGKTYVICRNSV